ncbi:MAG: hypothetical protein ACQERU_07750 [Bacteroidota bacterium]
MKNIIHFFTSVLFLLFALTGCEKETFDKINKEDISGKWVNVVNSSDTLFINDSTIKRTDTTTMLPKHSYSYSLYNDSIKILYTGEYYILAPESSHRILLDKNKSTLTIEKFENYFPEYEGNDFKRIFD